MLLKLMGPWHWRIYERRMKIQQLMKAMSGRD
jgi:hypothetical protein